MKNICNSGRNIDGLLKARGAPGPGAAPFSGPEGLCLAAALAALAAYAQLGRHGFVTYDDPEYVTQNPLVRAGLTARGTAWAFTTFYTANWHPLTWLSHMLDCQLFGLDAGAHHLVSLALHLGAALLLFLALRRLTRQPWRSALVAAVFALHPLHVESVAWIAERKDVLSGFFGTLTLLLYARYAEAAVPAGRRAPAMRCYALMALAFALGLMAKPMLVTLPLVLLLLDFWPLKRIEFPAGAFSAGWRSTGLAAGWLLLEKAPLFLLAVVSGGLTFLAHRDFDQPVPLALFSLPARLANAAVAYAAYLGKAFWPVDLAVLYPYHPLPAGQVLAAAVLLAAVTAAALVIATVTARPWGRPRPYFLVGWLWFCVMLAPVSGLAQTGIQAMADRYMYLPLTGLALSVVWGFADLVEARRFPRGAAAFFAAAVLLSLAAATYRQAAYWKDSRTLYEHTLAVTAANPLIHNNLGVVLEGEGRHREAMEQYRTAIALLPDYAAPHENLGLLLGQEGRLGEAIAEFTVVLRLRPRGDPDAENSLCAAYFKLGRPDEALRHCNAGLSLKPEYLVARANLGIILAAQGKKAEAAAAFSRVLEADPDFPGLRARLERLGGARQPLRLK